MWLLMGPRPVLLSLGPLVVLLLFCCNASALESWCVADPSATDAVLLAGLNWACGQGGANCSPINKGGSCFQPNTVHDHASYAFNAYFLKNPSERSCDFGGSAIITNTDPSTGTCKYPPWVNHAARHNIGGHKVQTRDMV